MSPSPASPTPDTTTSPSTGDGGPSTGGASPGAEPAAQAAQDLAGRLGIAVDDVTIVRAVGVTWRSGALGCAQEGMVYAQVLTDGMLIELEAEGRTYSYHSGPDREPFLCENPDPPLETDI